MSRPIQYFQVPFVCWAVSAILAISGCGTGKSHDEANNATPGNSPKFELKIKPVDGQPNNVVVVVTSSDVSAWSTVSASPQNGDRKLRKLLSLRLVSDDDGNATEKVDSNNPPQPSMLGKYEINGDQIRFTPAFPLLAGRNYLAVFDPIVISELSHGPNQRLQQRYRVPAGPTAPPPEVLTIYPSGNIVPANHLKFYILFSEPMQQGDIFSFFSLKNIKQGEPVPRPFRHTELWSEDNRRLTLWFHPGRQKDGVNLNVEIGPILNEGDRYRLRISGDWLSQRGTPLGETVTKNFRAGSPDRLQPSMEKWDLSVPVAETRNSFRCEFQESLDWALLHSEMLIEETSGRKIPGVIQVGKDETSWEFIPDKPWKAGAYRLAAGSVLEDLAGNSLERLFAVDLTNQKKGKSFTKKTPAVSRIMYREFQVTASKATGD